jgi:hypothetical protein
MIKHAPLRLLTGMLILCSLFVGAAFAQGDHYRFVMVSHIGSNDPNMNWLTTSMKTFDDKYPGVKTEYLSTNEYSLQNFIAILNQAIATHPDGIAVPILNNQALQPILDKAISSGIPVVAFNISDPRPVGERIHYLTYVRGDEYLTGLKLGEHVIELANAGKIPNRDGAAVYCRRGGRRHPAYRWQRDHSWDYFGRLLLNCGSRGDDRAGRSTFLVHFVCRDRSSCRGDYQYPPGKAAKIGLTILFPFPMETFGRLPMSALISIRENWLVW